MFWNHHFDEQPGECVWIVDKRHRVILEEELEVGKVEWR